MSVLAFFRAAAELLIWACSSRTVAALAAVALLPAAAALEGVFMSQAARAVPSIEKSWS
jgi:hypothetical protein